MSGMDTTPVTLTFDRLPNNGGWVAIHTHDGRTVAACVFRRGPEIRWTLAGDLTDRANRPEGSLSYLPASVAEAAAALGAELGVNVTAYEVTP